MVMAPEVTRRLSRVALDSPAAVLLVDLAAGHVTYANPLAEQLAPGARLPVPVEEWSRAAGLRDRSGALLGETDSPLVRIAAGAPVIGEAVSAERASRATARREPLWVVGLPLSDGLGPLAQQALVAFLPLRDEAAVQGAQAEALDLASRAVIASSTAFTISDATLPDNPLVWVNPAFEQATGYSAETVLGRNCRFLQGPETDPAAVARIGRAIRDGQPAEEVLLNYRADGTAFWNALVITPLRGADGAVRHFVGVQTDVTARIEVEEQRAAAHAKADAALAAERAARADAEAAHERAVVAQRRLALLAEASSMLSATLQVDVAAQRLCDLAVPLLADWAVLTLVAADGTPTVHARHRDGLDEVLDRWVELHPALLRRGTTTSRVLSTGEPALLTDLSPDVLRTPAVGAPGDELAEMVGTLGLGAVIVVPLVARRRVIGVLSLVAGSSGRTYDEEDLAVAADLARRAALALDNARLYAAERSTAVTLQRSLLPVVPRVPGLETAAVYLPGNDRAEVGGDWYDVLPLPDGAVGLVVGDVMGHDLAAAAAMGQLRSVLRAYAWEGAGPASALDRLCTVVRGLDVADLATCVYARLEGAGTAAPHLRWSNAGHHPPLLRTPDGAVHALDGGAGVVIGVDPLLGGVVGRPEDDRAIAPGSVLLLFTDGLVERRGDGIDAGLEQVRATLAAHDPADGPEALTRALTEQLAAEDQEGAHDDVCLLAVRVL